jgi:hypothetical protein
MSEKGFSLEKSRRICEKALALAEWFRKRGERPDVFMDLWSEIVVADDQTLTPAEIALGQEIARERGWVTDGDPQR